MSAQPPPERSSVFVRTVLPAVFHFLTDLPFLSKISTPPPGPKNAAPSVPYTIAPVETFM